MHCIFYNLVCSPVPVTRKGIEPFLFWFRVIESESFSRENYLKNAVLNKSIHSVRSKLCLGKVPLPRLESVQGIVKTRFEL